MNQMRVMTVGDVVGPEAAAWLGARLPELRAEYELDWIVVNAENAAVTGPSPYNGFGTTRKELDALVAGGADVITGGNHSWDGPEVAESFAYPQVVRPLNVSETRGKGVLTIGAGDKTLTVVNLLSPGAVGEACLAPKPTDLWDAWTELVEGGLLQGTVVVDLHSGSSAEKAWFSGAVDGQVAAVVGTHTHDGTIRAHLLPGGTGFVAELGMAGRLGFSGFGFDPIHFVKEFRGEDTSSLPPFQLATGDFTLGAAIFDIADGLTTSVIRIDAG